MNKIEFLYAKYGNKNNFFKIEEMEFSLSPSLIYTRLDKQEPITEISYFKIDIEENHHYGYGYFEKPLIKLDKENNYEEVNKKPLSIFLFNNLIDKIDNYLFSEYYLKQKLGYKLLEKHTKEKVKKI